MKHVGIMAWLLLAAACDPGPACDPGQYEDTGSCFPLAATSDGGAGDDDAGAAADSGSGCTPDPGNYDGFGDACSSDTQCSCSAPTCALAPGPLYCTRLECQDDPLACPSGWGCTDISAASGDPAVTHICLKM
jgi:hypothetical protein